MVHSVLIVDDDEVFRNTLKAAMEKRGLKAFAAESGEEGLGFFRENHPDLVVLDYRMPALDGVSVLRSMHVLNPSSVFLLLTGFGSVPVAVDAMKEGADSVLTKPCDVDRLLSEANGIFDKKKKSLPGMELSELRSFNLGILERIGIEKALTATAGNVSKAAILLGIDRRTLQRKMKHLFCFVFFSAMALSVFGRSALAARKMNHESKAQRLIELTGNEAYGDEQTAWNRIYARSYGYVYGRAPAKFLRKYFQAIPKGRVLDLAMGEGRNAVFLAKKGYKVTGVDISQIAIHKAQLLAADNHVKITTVVADLNKYRIKPHAYKGIIVFYYLQRDLIPQIRAGLKKGGVVIFETYTVDQRKNPNGSTMSRDSLLKHGELRHMFRGFKILYYSETNHAGNAIASLVAKKVT